MTFIIIRAGRSSAKLMRRSSRRFQQCQEDQGGDPPEYDGRPGSPPTSQQTVGMLTPGEWQEEVGRNTHAEQTTGRTLLRLPIEKGSPLKVLVGGREETPGGQRDDCPSNGGFVGWTVPVVRSNIGLNAHEFTHVRLVSVSGCTRVEVSGPHTTICSL